MNGDTGYKLNDGFDSSPVKLKMSMDSGYKNLAYNDITGYLGSQKFPPEIQEIIDDMHGYTYSKEGSCVKFEGEDSFYLRFEDILTFRVAGRQLEIVFKVRETPITIEVKNPDEFVEDFVKSVKGIL